MQKDQKYKLISFNGTIEADGACEPSENYWKLIGQCGTLIQSENKQRVLIQFEKDILKQGLEYHNSVPNTLWVLKSDLENT